MTDRSTTIQLDKPIVYKGSELHEIILNPPTIGAIRQAQAKFRRGRTDEAQTEFGIALIARCAGLDEESVNGLEADVFFQAMDFVNSFLPQEAEPKDGLSAQ